MPAHGRVWSGTAAPRLSRRRAFRLAYAGIAAFAVACGDDVRRDGDTGGTDDTGGSGTPSPPVAEEQAVLGGILSQRITMDPQMDPHQATTATSVWPAAPCFNQLVQFDPSQPAAGPEEILPDLAERWEQPDPTTLIFALKPGVTFHDGAAFSSQDPRVQLEWMLNPPDGKASPRRGALLAIDAIETPDPSTLRIRLKQPAPSLLMNLASHFFAIGQARDILTHGEVSDRLIGTGPFKLREYLRSSVIELEKNGAYHVPGRPYLDGLRFYIAGDYAAALANFIDGQYQIFYDSGFTVADQERVRLATGDKVEPVLVPSTLRDPVFMNRRHKPYDDPRVRQAISLALDRDAAIKVIKEGAGRRGGYMAPNGVWAISEGDLKRYEGYDKPNIEKARQLLQQAGVLTPFDASLVTRSDAQ
ncbi:MAG: ABC transporter substrate-binding protein, partial [Dehalococcoidia bacterium]